MTPATDTLTFHFTASRADGTGGEIRITVELEDDGSLIVDLEDEAAERAESIACKRLATDDVELISV